MIEEKLSELKEFFGSYTKLGLSIGVTPQAVNEWRVKGKIPAGAAVEIERVSKGHFKAVNLAD